MEISSLQNPKVKFALSLRERKDRKESGLFLIEGYRELKRAVDAGWQIEQFFYCPEFFLGENEQALIDQIQGAHFICSSSVFQKLSYRDRPDGILAIGKQKQMSLSDLPLSKIPFLLIAEKIEKPGNLGTILRSADAAGVDAVIVADPTTDLYNPNVVRSSVGTLFTVPVLQTTTEEALRFLAEHKIAIVAATPHASLEMTESCLEIPLAIVVGTEQYGLSETWMEKATIQVRIPMFGKADSLNVASAATLLLYEVVRQRRNHLQR
jgi:TrmH family RNA methyltransferase